MCQESHADPQIGIPVPFPLTDIYFVTVLWIRIQIGSVFSHFVDPDQNSKQVKNLKKLNKLEAKGGKLKTKFTIQRINREKNTGISCGIIFLQFIKILKIVVPLKLALFFLLFKIYNITLFLDTEMDPDPNQA